ncbi:Hypothetical protein PHPALM_1518 [Phytophthora palmivora]|uniref:RxLR effector PexRD54 WY domain-containing protein n=1 Tax=Phytophthora palmivora TaxID=4796 RepID=A0A2P4YS28_9STRA|nr:Hypothetical protein PHPALM_1518 [Phytophthora palmivora]
MANIILIVCVEAVTPYKAVNAATFHTHPIDRGYKRHLKTPNSNDDDSSENRGFDLAAGATKLKDLANKGTQKIREHAQKLATNVKIKMTGNNQQKTDMLFKNLKVAVAEAKIFDSPQFSEWTRSVAKLYREEPKKGYLAMVATLTAHYGDDGLAKMIAETKEVIPISTVMRLDEAQLARWVNQEKSLDDVFMALKLEKKGDKLFESPVISTWYAYAIKLDDKDPEKQLLASLKTRYDDQSLAKTLVAGKEGDRTVSLAMKLEKSQIEDWVASRKPNDVFNLLKLDEDSDNLLKNPLFKMWTSYLQKLDTKTSSELVFQKLSALYNDAKQVEKARIENWLSNGKTADDIANDIFNSLKLNTGDNIFETKTSRLVTWISNVELMEKPENLMISVLKKHYDDEALTNLIAVAKKDYRTRGVARKLEEARLNTWITNGESADNVFKILQLSKERDGLLTSASWSTWISYVTKLDNENPDELMLPVLKKQYGDEGLAAIIANGKKSDTTETVAAKLQEEVWRSEGKNSDDIFNLLFGKIKNDEMFEIFERAEFSTWINYITKLNKLNKINPDEFFIVSALEKQFEDKFVELARALETAKKKASLDGNVATKNIVRELQTQQFKKLMSRHMDPIKLGEFLNVKEDKNNLGVLLAYYDYYKNARSY